MPELPEVETIRRGLSRLIVGKSVTGAHSDNPKSFPNSAHDVEQFLVGSTITRVHRRAKVLLIDLSTNYSLVIHLKMTGQLVWAAADEHSKRDERGALGGGDESADSFRTESEGLAPPERFGAGHPNDSLLGELPDKSTRVTLEFTDGSSLFFNDQRKFGWVKLYPTIEVPNIDFMQRVGPEPLEDSFTGQVLYDRLQRRKRTSIKAAILDQSVLAGVGNIYADESLWDAGIHPATLVGSLSPSSITRLTSSIKSVMTLSIEKGGSTDKNYLDAEGKRGSYLTFAHVFRREGQPCHRCNTPIEKSRVAGRGTHTCPTCQPQ